MKKDLDPKLAEEIAEDFLERTKDLYKRYELAGSLRRKEPVVHDIDFAVIPKGEFGTWRVSIQGRSGEPLHLPQRRRLGGNADVGDRTEGAHDWDDDKGEEQGPPPRLDRHLDPGRTPALGWSKE